MQVVSLRTLIDASEESREVSDYLLSFTCLNNKDVERFLHETAIENEKANRTRTSLVIDRETAENEIIGYFTIMIKSVELQNVSNTLIKRLNADKYDNKFPSILIAQLGRSDSYKGVISGTDILDLALGACKGVFDSTALRIVCVEYQDVPFLHEFYRKNDFKVLQKSNTNNCVVAYYRLD